MSAGGLMMADRIYHYPENVEFELTLDGDAPENQPLEMVRRHPGIWTHKGATVKGIQTRRFKWVSAGHCRNLDEVRTKLKEYGKIPEGQWREAIKFTFFWPDGKHHRAVADASWWFRLSRHPYFLYVDL